MLPYTNRARSADAKEAYELSRSCTYDLMCAVVHVGEIDTGHYICYCRVGEQVSASLTIRHLPQCFTNVCMADETPVVHFQ